jgi:hypothetical protein
MKTGRGLVAFMPEPEAVAMMMGRPVQQNGSFEPFHTKYIQSVEALKASTKTIPNPSINDIEPDYQTYLHQVSSTPAFQQAFQGLNWSFKIVEIDKLVCYQRWVDLDYVAELSGNLGSSPDPLTVLKFCIPPSFPMQASISAEPHSGSITISSNSPNLSVTGLSFGQAVPESPATVVFTLGVNANYVQVVKYKDRFIVKNGHHRLYTLRHLGITTTPCVYSEISDYALSGGDRPGFFSREIVLSSRPPSMTDFFDNSLAADIRIQPTMNVIRIKAEQFPVSIPPDDLNAESQT